MLKIKAVMQHAKVAGVLIAMDSNSRSTLWHDKLTNTSCRILEEFITNKRLNILNEDSRNTALRNRKGASNTDLTRTSDNLLRRVSKWEISDHESRSDKTPSNTPYIRTPITGSQSISKTCATLRKKRT